MIPPKIPLRIVGDVHGDSRAFAAAAETDRFLIQLGDLVDDGPDTPGVLRIMFRLLDEKRGLFLLGNHDFKLARALRGDKVRGEPTTGTRAVSTGAARKPLMGASTFRPDHRENE